jgi:hypothetical protein
MGNLNIYMYIYTYIYLDFLALCDGHALLFYQKKFPEGVDTKKSFGACIFPEVSQTLT